MPESTAPQPAADRSAPMIQRLQTLFSELSGIDAAALDPAATFLELGLDSLFLTQASGAIPKQFGVKVSLRDLLEDCPTLQALATRLVSMMPAEPAPERDRSGADGTSHAGRSRRRASMRRRPTPARSNRCWRSSWS